MPKDSYLGVGYGTSMDKVDMVAFVSSTSNPHVEDLFATSESRPPNDMQQDYIVTQGTSARGSGRLVLTASRLFNTGDSKDKVITEVSY